jgi:hypothetical protein
MRGSFRQTANRKHQFFPTQLAGRGHSSPLHQFRERRTASHRGDTSFGKKADIQDVTVRDLEAQFQDVAASRIFELYGCVRIRNFAGVSRMFEVVEKLGRIHVDRIVTCPQSTVETLLAMSPPQIISIPKPCKIVSSCPPTILPDELSLCNPARL